MDAKYRKMLKVMKEKAESYGPSKEEPWYLYILECCDGSFYTGIAKSVEKRLAQHMKGTASRFTRTRLPVKLIYRETCASRTAALVRECAVKSIPRKKKEALVKNGIVAVGKAEKI